MFFQFRWTFGFPDSKFNFISLHKSWPNKKILIELATPLPFMIEGHLAQELESPRDQWSFNGWDKPTWSPTWHAKDDVSWSLDLCVIIIRCNTALFFVAPPSLAPNHDLKVQLSS